MKITVNTKPAMEEIEVIINCAAEDRSVRRIVSALRGIGTTLLCARNGEVFKLDVKDIAY